MCSPPNDTRLDADRRGFLGAGDAFDNAAKGGRRFEDEAGDGGAIAATRYTPDVVCAVLPQESCGG